jgi:hypothetical protein
MSRFRTRRKGCIPMKRLIPRLLLLVSLAPVPVVAFEGYVEYNARHTRQHLVGEEARRLVRLVTAEQQRLLKASEQMLDTLASTPAIENDLSPECNQILATLLRRLPQYSNVSVVGLDGRFQCFPPMLRTSVARRI